MILKYYKQYPCAFPPYYATEGSACFDLKACLVEDSPIKIFSPAGFVLYSKPKDQKIVIKPGDRALIPTGLIFDIPENYSLRIHIRSSLALKHGLILMNSEGIVDSDYVDPIYAIIYNPTVKSVTVEHGDRIVQAELVPVIRNDFEEMETAPEQKTSRSGGFGSTGK